MDSRSYIQPASRLPPPMGPPMGPPQAQAQANRRTPPAQAPKPRVDPIEAFRQACEDMKQPKSGLVAAVDWALCALVIALLVLGLVLYFTAQDGNGMGLGLPKNVPAESGQRIVYEDENGKPVDPSRLTERGLDVVYTDKDTGA